MSQLILAFEAEGFDTTLYVKDVEGRYTVATDDMIFTATRAAVARKYPVNAPMDKPKLAADFFKNKLNGFEHEVFSIVFLDNQNRLIAYREMFHGTINSAAVYPREVVKAAVGYNAAAVILSHNHPSGQPEPSQADIALTRRLKEALALIDVLVLDHIIVAADETLSMAEKGLV